MEKKTKKSPKKEIKIIHDPKEESQEPLMDDYYYDSLHKRIVDFLVSGQMHSTLVGMVVSLDGDKSKSDFIEATDFADYIISFLKKVN
jgi:hypothetical protein